MNKRDLSVFARNVRALRSLRGWSIRQFALQAGIDTKTILSIEGGKGCRPIIEEKIAIALQTYSGRLWDASLISSNGCRLLRVDQCRWFFADEFEAKVFHERLIRSGDHPASERPRMDPDEIQDAGERRRLGLLGFSQSFSQTRGGGMSGIYYRHNVVEVYNRSTVPRLEGQSMLVLCDQGSLRVELGSEVFELNPGDTFAYIMDKDIWYEPTSPLTPASPTPVIRGVMLGVLSHK